MNTKELEQFLEAGTETQRIDFKYPMIWDVASLAKDILAMSNVQDGGSIIIGVIENKEKKVFEREGITDDIKKTYVIDTMKDQMRKFADPHVDFDISFPDDKFGDT